MTTPASTADRVATLLRDIDAGSPVLGADWLSQLEGRKREEAAFHDRDREGHRDEQSTNTRANRRFYDAESAPDRHLAEWLRGSAQGSTFLDYACGHGNQTIQAALAGAALAIGIDISEVSIRNAAENAASQGMADRTRFLQRDCEATGFPDGVFDRVLCSGMLHHLDLDAAFPELCRITAPGGRIFCYEALAHNPLIQLYRNRTPELRTEWERHHILGVGDLRRAARWFSVENVRFFNLVSPVASFLPHGPVRNYVGRLLRRCDLVLTRVPVVRLLSWVFTFELVKPA